jgi:hypothetical protein
MKSLSRHLFIPFVATLLIQGCGGGEGLDGETSAQALQPLFQEEQISETVITVCQSGPAIQEGQILDSTSKLPLQGVAVTLDGCTATTDENGNYILSNIPEKSRAVVNFEYEGYYKNSAVIAVEQYSKGTTSLSPNHLVYELDTYDKTESFDSAVEKTVEAQTGAFARFYNDSYSKASGELYTGSVSVSLAYENTYTDHGKLAFPGEYKGKDSAGNIVPLTSYGYMAVEIEDNQQNALSLNTAGVVNFPAVAELTASSVALWYYNYGTGLWIEEGAAARQSDGSYAAQISHSGTWSLSTASTELPGIYRAKMVYENGNPVKDARVSAIGSNWIQTDLSTDTDGIFEIKVIPGKEFTLSSYNYKWKWAAESSIVVSPIASGEIIEDRI